MCLYLPSRTLETVSHRLSKHLEFRQKYSAARSLFDSLLGVWIPWWNTVSLVFYYISKLVRVLWLVSLAGRTLPHGPLKFKVAYVAKLLRDLSPKFLNLYNKERLKTFFCSKLCAKAW